MIKWPILAYFLDLKYGIIYNRGTRYGIGRQSESKSTFFLFKSAAFVTPEVSLSQPPADLRP